MERTLFLHCLEYLDGEWWTSTTNSLMATRKENSLNGPVKENSYMSFERTLQTHRTFQWRFVYCLIGLNIEATILDLSCASLIIGLGSQWLSKVGISCLTLGLAWDGLRRFSEKVFHQNLRIGWTCCWHGALPSPHYQIFSSASTSLHHFSDLVVCVLGSVTQL